MAVDFKKRLKNMQSEAKEQCSDYTPGGTYAALPDDTYNFRVTATLDETKENKAKKLPARLVVIWKFTVSEGDYEGRSVFDRTIIEGNKVGLHICRDRIESLGYEWPEEDLEQLEDILDDVVSRAPLITAKTKTKDDGEYVNTRINIIEVLEPFGVEETVDAEGEVEETEPEPEPEQIKKKASLSKKKAEPEPEPEPEEVEEAEAEEVAETLQALLDFCAAQGIDGVTEENTVEEIVTAFTDETDGVQFKADELTEEEIELLTEIGAESCILKPAPAKKAVTKKAAAPAKKGLTAKKK